MKFLPIELDDEWNNSFLDNPECSVILQVFKDHYKKSGFKKPWIAYFVSGETGKIIGGGGFKGEPKLGKVEISYGTFQGYEGQGVGTKICKHLVAIALHNDSSVLVTARTLPDNIASMKVLEKSGFESIGWVYDEEDGEVLEWVFKH
ncbi:MAG TPA: GNAT family N-acetyltransferase [Saprospiraceae bacterium]|nr:GNAT family N-acetyltransferase [Saprospiraceae bacterium]